MSLSIFTQYPFNFLYTSHITGLFGPEKKGIAKNELLLFRISIDYTLFNELIIGNFGFPSLFYWATN